MAVGWGTPGVGGTLAVGLGGAGGVGDEDVGLGRGSVGKQLERVTAAMPESEAARKVRRAIPPGAPRESMSLRLSARGSAG
jgi:hypothetical protein